MQDVKFLLTGDTSVTLSFGEEISTEINRTIRAFGYALSVRGIAGIVETVPTYRSVTIHYKPEIIRHDALVEALASIVDGLGAVALPASSVLEIPVLYGGEMGPDLNFVAAHTGLLPDEVVNTHTSAPYLIYMLGFTPGFTYLGGMSKQIATPRLKTPRVRIPAGSVGIAGEQTGVYPIESPGGWQLIGRTPVKMYDPHRATPILPVAGDYIRFVSITEAEFTRIEAEAARGTYICRRYAAEEVTA